MYIAFSIRNLFADALFSLYDLCHDPITKRRLPCCGVDAESTQDRNGRLAIWSMIYYEKWNIETNSESGAIRGLSDAGAILEDNLRWRCISVTPYEKPISFHDYIIFELRLIGNDTSFTTAMRSFETEFTEVAFLWYRLLHAPCIRQMLLRLTPLLHQRPWAENIDKRTTIFE